MIDSVNEVLEAAAKIEPQPWPELLRFAETVLPPFPVDVLPDWLATFVRATATSIQVPIDLPGTLALAALSTACAGSLAVHPWGDWSEPLNLYTVTVLAPGERKTAAFQAVTAPIVDVEAGESAVMAAQIAEQTTERKIKEQRLATAQQMAAKATEAERDTTLADAMALAVELERMRVAVAPQRIADDVTPEAIARMLAEQDGRLAILSDEADLFDIVGGRYSKDGAPNIGNLLKAHAGSAIRVNRTGRAPLIVLRPALTIGITMQPDVLTGLADHPGFRGRGLLARLLYCLPQSYVGVRKARATPVPAQVGANYRANLGALLRLGQYSEEPAVLSLTPEAQAMLEAFSEVLEPRLGRAGDLASIAEWALKLAGAVCRIAGLLHAARYPDAPTRLPIDAGTLDAAISLGNYYTEHARAAFAAMGADPEVSAAKRVLTWILEQGEDRFTKRQLYRALRGSAAFQRVEALDAPLRRLQQHGYIRPEEEAVTKAPGRPSESWRVNPAARRAGRIGHIGHIGRRDSEALIPDGAAWQEVAS